MSEINFGAIEKKWQERWSEEKAFEANEDSKKEKFYVLEMFPYPSGTGLHMGHALNYTIGDILARFKRMKGFNVLHPMGFDALGLPAENAAIKAGTHPEDYTNAAIENFIKQQRTLGVTYDWTRMVNSASSEYYKWDQWIFLKMLEKGLAYQKEASVNWCPKCNTVLANEQVEDGKCWRHEDTDVEVRKLKQWFFKTTEYAQELLDDIEKLNWPDRTRAMQRNWIGRSEGAEIIFKINGEDWKVFTTRPDTIFGVTFMVVASGHDRLDELVTPEQREAVDEYLKNTHSVSAKDIETREKEGVFTGSYALHPISGEKIPIWAGNFVLADYGSGMVMAVPAHDTRDYDFAKKYGIPIKQVVAPSFFDENNPPKEDAPNTERNIIHAIVVDEEEEKFIALRKKGFDWVTPITGGIDKGESPLDAAVREVKEETGYQNFGVLKEMPYKMRAVFHAAHKGVNRVVLSHVFVFKLANDEKKELSEEEASKHDVDWLPISELGSLHPVSELPEILEWFNLNKKVHTGGGVLIDSGEFTGMENEEAKNRIVDSLASEGKAKRVVNFKLRDWGISRQRYWGTPIPVVYCKDCGCVAVPEKDLPIELPKDVKFGEGNPLASADDWILTTCPKCGGVARRETDTMDTFVNSSWYFLRYADSKNNETIFDKKKAEYWNPVDVYIGGAEHACMHLLYARFYLKFLRDIGMVDYDEPFTRLFHQGMLHAEDGRKMSKSLGNVVEPIETMKKYGVDATRWFLISVASPDKNFDWSESGISGATRFMRRVYGFYDKASWSEKDSGELLSKLNLTLKNLEEYYGDFGYRKATIELRELFSEMEKGCSEESAKKFAKMISPIAPHLAEEVWHMKGWDTESEEFISDSSWPKIEETRIMKKGQSAGDLNDKIIERIRGIVKEETERVYVYVMPFELMKVNQVKISEAIGREVRVFAVNDSDKVDPKGFAKRAKPGMASIYLE